MQFVRGEEMGIIKGRRGKPTPTAWLWILFRQFIQDFRPTRKHQLDLKRRQYVPFPCGILSAQSWGRGTTTVRTSCATFLLTVVRVFGVLDSRH